MFLRRKPKAPNLASKAGMGYASLMVLSIPLFMLLMSVTIDGLAMAATYRHALALATIGVQAGSTSVDFNGGAPQLNGNACSLAEQTICDNMATSCSATINRGFCSQNGNDLTVVVRLQPKTFFNGAAAQYGLSLTFVQASVTGGPVYGINGAEN